jgi:hypothetical protein
VQNKAEILQSSPHVSAKDCLHSQLVGISDSGGGVEITEIPPVLNLAYFTLPIIME